MKKFGVKSRAEREKEKNADKLNKTMSFTVSPKLKEEIQKLKDDGNFESMSEFLRVCVAINKTLTKLAKDGFVELVGHNPKTKKRKFVHIGHLVDLGEKKDDNTD